MAAISDLQISASFEKAAKRREAIRANPDGNTRNREAREARFHGEQKTEWWPRVKSAHSSFFRSAFSPLFSLLSNGQEREERGGVGVQVRARNATRKTACRPDIRAKRTDVLFPLCWLAKSRTDPLPILVSTLVFIIRLQFNGFPLLSSLR